MNQTCTRCKTEKPIDMFYRRSAINKGGFEKICKQCVKERSAAWYLESVEKRRAIARAKYWENPELSRKKMANRREKTPEVFKKYDAKHYKENREERLKQQKLYSALNSKRACERASAWKKRNKPALAEISMKRYARKLEAIPLWADQELTRKVYEDAQEFREFGLDVQVDHIVPLSSKLVCGLHVASNLRVLLTTHNRKKSNREWPDMPT